MEPEKKDETGSFQEGDSSVDEIIESANINEDKKKLKKVISVAILLGGLFAGSLFVDVVQVIKGSGFSQKSLNKGEIFESNGKTWVAYNEPIVRVKVISDDACEACDPSEALVLLRKIIPTLNAEKIAQESSEGKELMSSFSVNTIPAFIFSKEIEKTEFYMQAAPVLDKNGTQYSLRTVELGLPAGKYVSLPEAGESDIQIGPKDAKVKIVEFSDFQCPFCRSFHASVKKTLDEYHGRVLYVYKHFPLNFHLQAENAALAAECANEQGKFMAYGDKLFETQSEWQNTGDTQKFKNYAAQLGLNGVQFNKCVDEKKYQAKIEQGKSEGASFGVSGTPATFINGQFKNGAIGYEELKKTIDEELAK